MDQNETSKVDKQVGTITVPAVVRFPLIVTREPVRELVVRLDDANIRPVAEEPLSEPLFRMTPAPQSSPSQIEEETRRVEEQRELRVVAQSDGDDLESEMWSGRHVVELYCAWLSYLSLSPFRILMWDQGEKRTPGRAEYGILGPVAADPVEQPDVGDTAVSKSTTIQPHRFLDLTEWLTCPVVRSLDSSLYWLRKGMVTHRFEDKLVFFFTAIEAISEAIQPQEPREEECPQCGQRFQTGPAASKSGILFLLRDHLGYSRSKTYEPLLKERSGYVHGAVTNADKSMDSLRVLADGAFSVAVAGISFFLATATDIHFPSRQAILTGRYDYQHPVKGRLGGLKGRLDRLAGLK